MSTGSSAGDVPSVGSLVVPSDPSGPKPFNPRRWLWIAVKLGVMSVILIAAFHHVDSVALRSVLRIASPGLIAVAVIVFMLSSIMGGLRWWCLFRAMRIVPRLGPVTAAYWIGVAFGQIMPAAASDGARMLILTRQGVEFSSVLRSVLVERAAMLGTLFLFAAASEPLLVHRLGQVVPAWVWPLMVVGGLAGWTVVLVADRIAAWVGKWRSIEMSTSIDRRDGRPIGWLVAVFILCVAANLNFVVAGVLVGSSLHLSLSFANYLASTPWVVLAMVIPISVNGWGVREALLVTFLPAAGASPENALAFSLLYGACGVMSSLPGLPMWWLNDRRINSD